MNIKDSFDKAKRIGLFDSGLGGLSVLKQLLMLPEPSDKSDEMVLLNDDNNPSSQKKQNYIKKEYVYFADTARCPYGGRSQSEIHEFVKQIVDWLFRNDVDLVIMACNTSAALVEPSMRGEFPLPMIDLLHSTGDIVRMNRYKRVGVMSTLATAKTKAFSQAITRKEPSAQVFELACPDLVPLVEGNKAKSREAVEALNPYAKELIAHNVEAIIYGCTHFPFLHESMRRCLTELNATSIEMIDPAICLTEELLGSDVPNRISATSRDSIQSYQPDFSDLNDRCRFVTTGNIEPFASGINNNLGLPFSKIETISVGDLKTSNQPKSSQNSTSNIHL
ncbi:MAG: glutamate racemase [Cyanobacteria bacterium TGS_CYA1]|nr:glutamate racemase [Cyanobacteria bacterium TGS_CYA1]